jgi:hypothetical protein
MNIREVNDDGEVEMEEERKKTRKIPLVPGPI